MILFCNLGVRRFDAAFFPSFFLNAKSNKEKKKESGVKAPHSKVRTHEARIILECGGLTPLFFFLLKHQDATKKKRKKAASNRRTPKK